MHRILRRPDACRPRLSGTARQVRCLCGSRPMDCANAVCPTVIDVESGPADHQLTHCEARSCNLIFIENW